MASWAKWNINPVSRVGKKVPHLTGQTLITCTTERYSHIQTQHQFTVVSPMAVPFLIILHCLHLHPPPPMCSTHSSPLSPEAGATHGTTVFSCRWLTGGTGRRLEGRRARSGCFFPKMAYTGSSPRWLQLNLGRYQIPRWWVPGHSTTLT